MFKHILVYVYFEFIYSYFVPAFRVFVPPGAKGWLDHQKRGSNRCTSSLCGPVHSFVVRQHFSYILNTWLSQKSVVLLINNNKNIGPSNRI